MEPTIPTSDEAQGPLLEPAQLTLAVLAGGSGRRLGGAAKGLLCAGGVTFLERALRLSVLCRESILISSDPAYDRFGARRVEDVEPGRGAPGGVVTALLSATTDWVLVVACDMPQVVPAAARPLLAAAEPADVRCYRRGGVLEPLFAVYRACLGTLWLPRLAQNPRLRDLVSQRPLRTFVPDDPRWLVNVNTPEELAAVES